MIPYQIMVVEDKSIIAMDIAEDLEALGYNVCAIINSGEEAIEKATKIKPDLILMDIILKGEIDGINAAEYISHHLDIPVVFLTAHTDKNTLTRAKSTQAFGYIVKPFDRRDLQTAIEMAFSRYEAEKRIQQALQKEKEINQLKSRFISMVSHEFRTPMSTILFSAGLLEKCRFKWSEDKKLIHIHRIQKAIEEMNVLLDDILVIGKAEAEKLGFQPKLINLEDFCREIAEEIQLTTKENQSLNFICKEENECAWVDEKLLRHILCNLLSNAIKYSPENTIIRFELTYQNIESKTAIFQIQDQGIGIPDEDQKQLFETFHRASNVDNISGTGLGLAIAKKAVEAHGGQITVESKVGVGTTFTVTIPLNS